MKVAEYKVPKGVVELFAERELPSIAGKTIKTRESETDAELLDLVEDKNPEHRRKLAQSALDIIVQRAIREYLESDEATALCKSDGLDSVLAAAQVIADEYVYSGRKEGTGTSTVTRAKVAATDSVLAAIDITDESKLKRMRALLGDAAVEGLIAAKKAQEDAATRKAEADAKKAATVPTPSE